MFFQNFEPPRPSKLIYAFSNLLFMPMYSAYLMTQPFFMTLLVRITNSHPNEKSNRLVHN